MGVRPGILVIVIAHLRSLIRLTECDIGITVLSVYPSVCLSNYLKHSGIVSERINIYFSAR